MDSSFNMEWCVLIGVVFDDGCSITKGNTVDVVTPFCPILWDGQGEESIFISFIICFDDSIFDKSAIQRNIV